MSWKKMGQSILDLSIEGGKEFVNKMDKKTQSIERLSEKKAKEQGVSLSDRFYKKMDDMYDTIDDAYDFLDIMEDKYHSSFKNTTDGYEVDDFEYVDDIEDEEIKCSTNNHNYEEYQEKISVKPITIDNYEEKLQKAIDLFLEYKLDEAFVIFKALAENGISRAMYHVAQYYLYSYGSIRENKEMYRKWFAKGKETGEILCNLYTTENKKDEDYKANFEKVFWLAQKGDMFAQAELAFMYKYGYGTSVDENNAWKWKIRAAEQGYWPCIEEIEVYYMKADRGNILKCCYKIAAENGVPEYQFHHGMNYICEEDFLNGVKWLEKSANGLYDGALLMLGSMYYEGYGVEQDFDKAKNYYLKALELGCDIANEKLARMK